MSDAPDIEVLIPHHNRAASLARTLDALAAQTLRAEVCVIDNASTDGTAEMLSGGHPEVRVVSLAANLGFGAAINRGAETSRARLLVLLNNDAVPDARFIELIEAAQRGTGAEMVAACLRSPDGRVESLGVEVDRSLNAYDAGHGGDFEPGVAAEPLGPTGGAGAYLRAAFNEVGGFDETIFAYLEDVDLAIRMRLAGMTCAVQPAAFAYHEHSATLGARSAAKNELVGFARGYLLWKHGRSLPVGARAWAHATDAIVYLGKAVMDRNVSALRGRLRARRVTRSRERPGANPALGSLPLLDLGRRASLRRRLERRR